MGRHLRCDGVLSKCCGDGSGGLEDEKPGVPRGLCGTVDTNKKVTCTGEGQTMETAEQEATINPAQHQPAQSFGRAQESQD